MRKELFVGLLSMMFLVSIVAAKPAGPQAVNGLNNPSITHLYLYEKDIDWNIVEDGAWGKLSFTDNFVFRGHGLESGTEYTLINYYGWPGSNCLGTGVANKGGNLNIKGVMPDLVEQVEGEGSKIWLVPSSDVDCDEMEMTSWNPSEYLFEYNTV